MKDLRWRLGYTLVSVVTVAVGLGARRALSGWTAKYLGVALWSTLVYWLVLACAPRLRPARAFGVTVAISFAVELFQLTPIPYRLGQVSVLFQLVFGMFFSAWDLPVYVVGSALGAALHALLPELKATTVEPLKLQPPG
ncbi:MAG: DUF2809 domain-containing protein [Deltaproteobacteria bacterium]|nr:DUF2809 domain-containing protein [Deltaproteobacteria bacterium]